MFCADIGVVESFSDAIGTSERFLEIVSQCDLIVLDIFCDR